MNIVIAHKKTKREIDGPFALCCSRADLERLKAAIEEGLNSEIGYGWIYVDEVSSDEDYDTIKRQKQIPNTEPISWE